MVYEVVHGDRGAIVFRRIGDAFDRGISCIPDREAAADKLRNQYADISGTAGRSAIQRGWAG